MRLFAKIVSLTRRFKAFHNSQGYYYKRVFNLFSEDFVFQLICVRSGLFFVS